MTLRPYQLAAVDAVSEWVRTRDGHPLLVIPTGGGKTVVMSELVRRMRASDPHARALILAHRKELLEQAMATAMRTLPAIDVGMYTGTRKDRRSALTVSSVQALQRDAYAIGAQDLVLVDECHLVPNDAGTGFRKTLHALHVVNPRVTIVGLTATPYRLGTGFLHTGDDALFSGIAYEVTIPTLLADGYLCPVRPRATAARLSTAGVAVRGDYVTAALAAAVDVDATTRAIVRECVTSLHDRACWLAFAVSVEHAEHLASAFTTAGVPSVAVHGSLSAGARREALAAFRDGSVRCAVTCDLLTTGFDHPRIDAIIMCRPTKSPGLYYQMVGRGFRVHAEKVDCVVLDFAGNTMRHGPLDTLSERITTRGPSEGGVAPAKECPCGAIVPASALKCAECGHEWAQKPPALEKVAANRPLLSTDVALPEWRDVTDVVSSATQPRDPSKRPTLRIDYLHGFRTVASEWVCVEHDEGSYAHSKAVQWWRERFVDQPMPTTAEEAAEVVRVAPPLNTTPVAVCVRPDGQYERVVAVRWPSDRATALRPSSALPRACWTCAAWQSEMCSRAGAVPPESVQQQGCELWSEMDDADDFARAMLGVAA